MKHSTILCLKPESRVYMRQVTKTTPSVVPVGMPQTSGTDHDQPLLDAMKEVLPGRMTSWS